MPARGWRSAKSRRTATASGAASVSGLQTTTNGALVAAIPRFAFAANPAGRSFAITGTPWTIVPQRLSMTTSSCTCGISAARHRESSGTGSWTTTTAATLTGQPQILDSVDRSLQTAARAKPSRPDRDIASDVSQQLPIDLDRPSRRLLPAELGCSLEPGRAQLVSMLDRMKDRAREVSGVGVDRGVAGALDEGG